MLFRRKLKKTPIATCQVLVRAYIWSSRYSHSIYIAWHYLAFCTRTRTEHGWEALTVYNSLVNLFYWCMRLNHIEYLLTWNACGWTSCGEKLPFVSRNRQLNLVYLSFSFVHSSAVCRYDICCRRIMIHQSLFTFMHHWLGYRQGDPVKAVFPGESCTYVDHNNTMTFTHLSTDCIIMM
jgi:hypothetical protein